jgi:transposase
MKKISTVAKNVNEILKEPRLTIGLDLGDRTSHFCILDEAGNVILEHNLPTTPKGIEQVFGRSWHRTTSSVEPFERQRSASFQL